MIEKRFVSEDDCCGYYTEIIDNEKELDLSLHNPKKNLTIEELVDLLNKLVDENKQLQKDCTALIYNNQEYRKENGQLKQQIQDMQIRFKRKYDYEFDEIVDEKE